ncbi:unnamed protein product [Rhizopus stolonifer]
MEPPHKRRMKNTEFEPGGFDHIVVRKTPDESSEILQNTTKIFNEDSIFETKSSSPSMCQFQKKHDVPDPQQSSRLSSVSTTAAVRLQIRAEDNRDLAVRVIENGTIVEIVFNSVQGMVRSYTEGIKVKDIQVLGNPTCQSGFKFINMELSELPFLSEEELCKGLLNLCAPMGTIMEVGINKSFGWFDGDFDVQKRI